MVRLFIKAIRRTRDFKAKDDVRMIDVDHQLIRQVPHHLEQTVCLEIVKTLPMSLAKNITDVPCHIGTPGQGSR